MANILEYTLNLNDNLSAKLKRIGIANDQQLDQWGRVQAQVLAANRTMSNMGVSIGSVTQRIAALNAQKEWIPASNRAAIRATNVEIQNLENQLHELNGVSTSGLSKWLEPIKQFVNPLTLAAAGVYKMGQYIGESKRGYQEEAIAVAKLQQVLQLNTGARQEEINSLLDLTSAYQQAGVVGDETQIAGMQELGTYVTKTETLKKLLPAMNDMLAQQYGLNASQESAANIAMMLGKVMNGQTGALSRYGYSFDAAQEKILKYGTESERAATLFDVVNSAVGGVNEALAATPDGKLKQAANNAGDIQEKVGKLAIVMEAAFLPAIESVEGGISRLADFFEANGAQIINIVSSVASAIAGAMGVAWDAIGTVYNVFSYLIDKVREGSVMGTIIATVTAAVVGYKLAVLAAYGVDKLNAAFLATKAVIVGVYTAATTAAATATGFWATAQATLNAVMMLNPVYAVAAGVTAVVAAIGYVIYQTEGWAKQWKSVVSFMKASFSGFVESLKLSWTSVTNGIMIGIDKMKLAWYQFRNAVGIGDSAENSRMIAQISKDVEARKDAIVAGAKKVAEYAKEANNSLTWELGWKQSGGTSTGTADAKTGIATPGMPGAAGVSGAGAGASGGSGGGSKTAGAQAIATGGTRNSTVNITIKTLADITFQGGFNGNETAVKEDITTALLQVLYAAQTAQ